VVLLQSFYGELMGSQFRYFFGILDSPNFDLFLWFVLCHRPDMAMIFWQWCKQPILTAIVAACMCRKMALHHNIQHALSAEAMQKSADFFEKLAIKVCQEAFKDDAYQAMAALEQPLPLWPGYKVIDLAYHARCYDFVSVCGFREINRRFAGDLLDFDHLLSFPGGFRVVLSVDAAVILMILCRSNAATHTATHAACKTHTAAHTATHIAAHTATRTATHTACKTHASCALTSAVTILMILCW